MEEFEFEGEVLRKEECVFGFYTTSLLFPEVPQIQTIRKLVYDVKIGNEIFSFEVPPYVQIEEGSKVRIKVRKGLLRDSYLIFYEGKEIPSTLLPNIFSTSAKNK